MLKVLLTGSSGQVGSLLQLKLEKAGFEVRSFDSKGLDISSTAQVLEQVSWNPQIIINAAAYTAVDKAEQEVEKAFSVNSKGVENLLALAKQCDCPVINISTDYVFNGQATAPYQVDHITSPLGVYGQSKRAGEELLEVSQHPYINIRTSWVFGENGNNFVKTMLRLGQDKENLSIVADQVGCPTYAGDIAAAIVTIVKRYRDSNEFIQGHYHFCGDIAVSWFEFAKHIFDVAARSGTLTKTPKLQPIPTSSYPTPAARPAYSVMDCSKLKQAYSISPSDWKSALEKIIPSF